MYSILEHAAQMGMGFQNALKQVLLKLRGGETGKSDKEDSNGKTGELTFRNGRGN